MINLSEITKDACNDQIGKYCFGLIFGFIGLLAPIPFLSIFLMLCLIDTTFGTIRVIVKKQKFMQEIIVRQFGKILIMILLLEALSLLVGIHQIWAIIPNAFATIACLAEIYSITSNAIIISDKWGISNRHYKWLLKIIETQQENVEKNTEKILCVNLNKNVKSNLNSKKNIIIP